MKAKKSHRFNTLTWKFVFDGKVDYIFSVFPFIEIVYPICLSLKLQL